MAKSREEMRALIKARAVKKKILKPKPARTLDKQKQRQAQQRRQQLRKKLTDRRKKVSTRPATTPKGELSEENQIRLQEIQRDFDGLQDDNMLTSVHDNMGDIESTLADLSADLEELRTKGYAFGSYLENKINVLTDKGEDISEQVDAEIEEQSDKLERESEEAEKLLRQAFGGNQAMVSRAESAVKTLQEKANSAYRALTNRYGDVSRTVYQTRYQLDKIKWAFEQADQATFEFLEGEFLITACQAKLLENPDEDEGAEGVLYLTDERLVNDEWSQHLNRARSGEIERERIAEAAAEKEVLTEQVSEAPTDCMTCGAPLPATIARGQGEITCEYCGTTVRL